MADGVAAIQSQIVGVSDSIFKLADAGHRDSAYRLAQRELKGRLQPALTAMNREIYRRARESSVRGAYGRLEDILSGRGADPCRHHRARARRRACGASWLISRSLARPCASSREAMAVVGAGELEHPIAVASRDEIGDLARAFARMTQSSTIRARRWCRRRSSPPSARCRPRSPMAFAILSRASARRRSWSGAIPTSPTAARAPRCHPRGGRPARPPDQPPPQLQPSRAVPSDAREPSAPGRGPAPRLRRAACASSASISRWTFPADLPSVRVDPVQLEQAHPGDRVQRARCDARGRTTPHRGVGAVGGTRSDEVVLEVTRYRRRHSRGGAGVGVRAVLHDAAGGHRTRARDRQALRGAERRPPRDRKPAPARRHAPCGVRLPAGAGR